MPALHLLVLQRDPERREAILTLLRGAGYHAVAAPDGPAAATALALPGFDLLLLDLGDPDLDLGELRQALAPAQPGQPDSLDAAERRHIAPATNGRPHCCWAFPVRPCCTRCGSTASKAAK